MTFKNRFFSFGRDGGLETVVQEQLFFEYRGGPPIRPTGQPPTASRSGVIEICGPAILEA